MTNTSAQTLGVPPPEGDGDVLIAHFASRAAPQPPDSSWQVIDTRIEGKRNHSTVYLKVLDGEPEPGSYTFSQDEADGRMALAIARLSSVDRRAPVAQAAGVAVIDAAEAGYPAPALGAAKVHGLVMRFWTTTGGTNSLSVPEPVQSWWSFGSKSAGRHSLTLGTETVTSGSIVDEILAVGPDPTASRFGHTLLIRAEHGTIGGP